MYSDRELLELAAKAAGIGKHPIYRDKFASDCKKQTYDDGKCSFQMAAFWDPLTDDGDALRLAVNLGIFVGRGAARLEKFHHPESEWIIEGWVDDPMPATRRSIVIAAAAIGEAIQ